MNQHVKPPANPIDLNREFVLGAIKSAIYRVDEIKQEMINAGIALKSGTVTAQDAIDWVEEFAPGCLGYIPPKSGLVLKRPLTTDEFKEAVLDSWESKEVRK